MVTRTILKNFLSLSFAEAVSKGVGFLSIIYLSRILGTEGFGKIGFARAVAAYFILLVELGLNTFGTREIARNKAEMNRYVNNILTMRLVASLISYIFLTVFVYFIPKSSDVKKLILLYGLSIFAFAFTIDWFFQGIERMEFFAISQIVKQLVYVGLLLLMIKSLQHVLELPLIQLFASVVSIIILFFVFTKSFSFPRLEFDFALWKQILKQSLPIGFSMIMVSVYYNFDKVMLGFMKGEEVVGWYSAACNVILALGAFNLCMPAIFPAISKYFHEASEKLSHLLSNVSRLTIMVAIPVGVGGVLLAEKIMEFLYGLNYLNGALSLKVLIVTQMVIWLASPFGYPLIACNRQNIFMLAASTGAVVNIILNFVLIPKYSLNGAAVAILISELAVGIVTYFFFRKGGVKFNYWSYYYKPLISAFGMGIIILILLNYQFHLITLIFIGLISYFAFIIFLRGITYSEVRRFVGVLFL